MRARDLIYTAAEHIEKNPDRYEYFRSRVPRSGNDRGCTLGWISYFGGYTSIEKMLAAELGATATIFYKRMSAIDGPLKYDPGEGLGSAWEFNARRAASCLREYADYYHPRPELADEWEEYRKFRANLDLTPLAEIEK